METKLVIILDSGDWTSKVQNNPSTFVFRFSTSAINLYMQDVPLVIELFQQIYISTCKKMSLVLIGQNIWRTTFFSRKGTAPRTAPLGFPHWTWYRCWLSATLSLRSSPGHPSPRQDPAWSFRSSLKRKFYKIVFTVSLSSNENFGIISEEFFRGVLP